MLLERATELRLVEEAWTSAADADGSLLIVTGPVGTGRTALLDALDRRAAQQGVRVLRASGTPQERQVSHSVVSQLFDSLVRGAPSDVRAGWLSGAAADTERLFDGRPPASAVARSPHFLDGLRSLVVAVSRERPLLLLVDDLHQADEDSLSWLGYLARRLDGLPVTVVATLPEGHPAVQSTGVREIVAVAAHRLSLRRLSVSGVAEAVRRVFGRDGDPEFVRACHEVSGGNPMLLVLVLLHLAEQEIPPRADLTTAVARQRPPLLRDRLLQQVLWQPEPLRECGSAVALLGREAHAELVASLTDLDTVACANALRALEEQGLLRTEGGTPCFVHPMIGEAFEEALSDQVRGEWHTRAARLLLSKGYDPAQVADHVLLTTRPVHGPLKAALRTAAAVELGRGRPRTAARYLRRALNDTEENLDTTAERAELLSELAGAETRFAPEAADRHLRQALALLSCPYERATALIRFPPSSWYAAVTPALSEIVHEVARDIENPAELPGEHTLPVWLEARTRRLGQGPEQAVECLARLRELGPDIPLDTWADRDLATVLLASAAGAGLMPRKEATALACQIIAREPASCEHLHTSVPLLTSVLVMADEVDIVHLVLGQALRRAERENDVVAQAIGRGLQSWVALARGDLTTARSRAAASLDATFPGHRTTEPALIGLAMIALESRDGVLAEWLRNEAQVRRDRNGTYLGSHQELARMLMGMTADLGGDHSAALAIFLQCGQWLEQSGYEIPGLMVSWRLWAARQHLRLNQRAKAVALVKEEAERVTAWGAPRLIGRTLRARACLASGSRALELMEESVQVLEAGTSRLELAKSLVSLGRLRRAAGDRAPAGIHLRRGRDLAAECGLPWLVTAAITELRDLGDGDTPGSGRPLTTAQRTVVDKALLGLTNREIAEMLGITQRAVEKHLTAAYRKLGVATRAELAALEPRPPASSGPGDPTTT
ncbi:helix-turn-helix transcriptional regulator [Streptomyces ipomoeae]|uniref:helix-turn-helix transcriptional regulator n=1 Tax=Streptomyces ipomoeae TaxID=103232 RepID=UPI0011465FE8|nr:LuxR family transcriptional regulator [Streptomyces ipomoeae]MDX2939103.1 AAA family ATPase [Streptomyces ipomoeae]TQE30893.1 LuxR family transcriptional regulator [Streptomyces ipomoeae]